jgi:hypothetical protein
MMATPSFGTIDAAEENADTLPGGIFGRLMEAGT